MKQCIFGDHLHYGDAFVEAYPEKVVFCLDCSRKHKDETKRKWIFGRYGIGHMDSGGTIYFPYEQKQKGTKKK